MNIEEYNSRLVKICRKKKMHLKKIGEVKKFPIYSISNSRKNLRTICFCAGIHGDEIAPSLAVLDFIENFDFNKLKNLNVVFIPIANPTGFRQNKRRNHRNIDLNRHFSDERLRGENKMIYNYLKKFKIYFFCSLHEDSDERSFYLYGFEGVDKKIYEQIIKLSKRFFLSKQKCVLLNGKCLKGQDPKNGIIMIMKNSENDGSIESRFFEDGIKFLLCTETPEKADLQERINLNKKIIEEVIKISSKL